MPVNITADDARNRCQNCGAFVTRDFARVFGNNDNIVVGCLDCHARTAVRDGHPHSPKSADTDR